jgi:hypothetical protein
VAISLIHFKRLPRPFRVRNDNVKIYVAFILVGYYETDPEKKCDEIIIKDIEFQPKIVEILPQNLLIT